MVINALFEDPRHFEELLDMDRLDGLYLPGERYEAGQLAELVACSHRQGKKCYYSFPYVFRQKAEAFYQEIAETLKSAAFDGFLIRSLDQAGFVGALRLTGTKIFDAGLYSWNRLAGDVLRTLGADWLTAPYELNRRELQTRGMEYTELVVYGHLPVMISAQCFCRTGEGCRRGQQEYAFHRLVDRKNAAFLAENRCRFCYNVVYNSVPLWLLDQQPDFPERIRFHFTAEEAGRPAAILKAFLQGECTPSGAFTRGHFTRGVE